MVSKLKWTSVRMDMPLADVCQVIVGVSQALTHGWCCSLRRTRRFGIPVGNRNMFRRPLPVHQAISCRDTDRDRRKCMGEANTLGSQLIQVGCLDQGMAVRTNTVEAMLVGVNEKDVWGRWHSGPN